MNDEGPLGLSPWWGVRPFERHSLVLLVAGMVYLAIGGSFFNLTPSPNRDLALHYALQVMGYEQWGLVFIFAGVLAIISSRYPPISETWGYQALTGLSAGWGSFYALGVIIGESPASNMIGFLTWGLFGFLWWAISGLVNPRSLIGLRFQLLSLQTENLDLQRELQRCKDLEE
jgi:hypothetical protein